MVLTALSNLLRPAAPLFAVIISTHAALPVAAPPAPPVLSEIAPVLAPELPRAKRSTAAPRTTPVMTSFSTVAAWRDLAEDESQVTPALGSARPLVQGDLFVEGAGAFHLANPEFTSESFILNVSILPEAKTELFFESRLGYATATQFARVQASTDNGVTWTSIWNRQGSGGAGDRGFQLETVSLAAYAGTSIRLRFLYEYTGGSAYTGVETSPPIGWFIDDIQIGDSFIKRPYTGTGEPTAQEVALLEFINRARADAIAEADRLASNTDPDVLNAMSYFSVDTALMTSQFAMLTRSVQPLAMNARLLSAARLHSQDMLSNVFQGHTSSATPIAPNAPFDTIGARITRQGYAYSSVSENVYAFAKNPWHAHAAFNIDWGTGTGGMQDPAGHRLAIHNGLFREVGIGAIAGTNSDGLTTVGPLVVTQDFGVGPGGGQPMITGVTCLDGDNDGFYDEGEGLGNVRIEVDGSSYYAISSEHGAYAVPVPGDGTYRVSFHRPGLPPVSQTVEVSGNMNVKADYLGQSIVVDSIERMGPSLVRLYANQATPPASLELQVSGDLLMWTNLPYTPTPLAGGLLRIDAELPDPARTRSFFRLRADWTAP